MNFFSDSNVMKIEKDKFNALSEKDQNLQLLRVRKNTYTMSTDLS